MATLTMEAVDRASQRNGTDASPKHQAISTEFPTMIILLKTKVLDNADNITFPFM